MTPTSIVGVPKSPLSVVFVAAAAPFGERRKGARLCYRPAVACGGRDEQRQRLLLLPLPSMAAVPASLRAIQAKRKMAAARHGVPRAMVGTNAAGCLVAALVVAVDAVQGAAVNDAMTWVFRKVHFESPDLAVGLLGLVASCLGTTVEIEIERMWAKEVEASASKAESDAAVDDDDEGDTEGADDLPELVGLDVEKELWSRIFACPAQTGHLTLQRI